MPTEQTAETKPTDLDFEKDWPNTDVVRKAQEYIKAQLSLETYNHSIRVYHYGEFKSHYEHGAAPAKTS